MSRTRRRKKTGTLFRAGSSNTHKSLKKELRESEVSPINLFRNGALIDRRDLDSDRLGGLRKTGNGKRRARMKRYTRIQIIKELE